MHERAKRVLARAHLDDVARNLWFSSRRMVWRATAERNNKAILDNYLGSNEIRKLHIGCGSHAIDGWLNADLFPLSRSLMHLDATEPFPINDGEFDYVFSEHMIEHISYPQGQRMLCEAYRVLKPNGRIRISTPNLAFLIDLYREDKSELQQKYIKWSVDELIVSAPGYDDTFVINTFVRAWGHQFIYDEKTLSASLKKAGFREVSRCNLNDSGAPALRNLENEERMPDGFVRLETISVEGTK